MINEIKVLAEARLAHAAGLCVVPPREDGSKAPLGAWAEYQRERPSERQLSAWYLVGRCQGLGIVTGRISGNVESPEWEDGDSFSAYRRRGVEAGIDDVVDRMLAGYLDATPGGGYRSLIRCDEIDGNLKLASHPCPGPPACDKHVPGKPHVTIETRGEGGFCILAPSSGKVHASGRPYRRLAGSFNTIATVTPEERAELYALARSFDEMPRLAPREAMPVGPRLASDGDRPGDRFNAGTTWAEVLEPHGWRLSGRHGEEDLWARPGKDAGISATVNYAGSDLLYVFTTSTEFESERSYDRFGAFAVLEHGGDIAAAAKALASKEKLLTPDPRPAHAWPSRSQSWPSDARVWPSKAGSPR